jgi:hypothetical protein
VFRTSSSRHLESEPYAPAMTFENSSVQLGSRLPLIVLSYPRERVDSMSMIKSGSKNEMFGVGPGLSTICHEFVCWPVTHKAKISEPKATKSEACDQAGRTVSRGRHRDSESGMAENRPVRFDEQEWKRPPAGATEVPADERAGNRQATPRLSGHISTRQKSSTT